MTTIYINNQLADYFDDLTIKKDSPLFANFDVEPSEHTYTLTLPTTKTNALIFSLVQYSLNAPATLPARIEVDGMAVLDGTCRVQSWSDSGYSVYFTGVNPHEIADNSTKALMTDERSMYDVFANYAGWENINIGSSLSGVKWRGQNIANKTSNYDAIVNYYVNRQSSWREGASGNVFYTESPTLIVGFSVGVMLGLIQEAFGVSIKGYLAPLADIYTITNSKVTTFKSTSEYYAQMLPRMSVREYLQGVSAMIGCKLNVNYSTNTILFEQISAIENKPPKAYTADKFQLNWQDTSIQKNIKFQEIKPLERKYKKSVEGVEEEVTIKEEFQLSQVVSADINENGNQNYTIPFALPTQYRSNEIWLSAGLFENNELQSPDDEQWGYSVICEVNADLIDSGYRGWFVDSSLGDAFAERFNFLKHIAERKLVTKISAKLTPLQFASIDFFSPIYIDSIGKCYIKSINYNSSGDSDSDIEAYIY